jgi:hypothetical protein
MNVGPSAAVLGGSLALGVGSGVMTFCINVILGFVLGFLGGAVIAFIYNLAPWGEMGGIAVDLETM